MQHDATVIGGGFAGLSAALYLARGRRSVRVIDTGRPRNRFAAASHGFFGHDGADPQAMLAAGRAQLLAYPTVRLSEQAATDAEARAEGFATHLSDGEQVSGRKLILAFGLRDVLPDIPGLRERWGRTVLHCPYCHGVEFSDQPLGVLYRTPMSVHQALLIAEWGPTTLFLNGAALDADEVGTLAARGVAVEPAAVTGVVCEGDALSAVQLGDGRSRAVAALYLSPESRLASPLAEQLGVAIDAGPLGPVIRVQADRMTSVPGVYATGDIARAPHTASWAVADGVTAGLAAHRALVFG